MYKYAKINPRVRSWNFELTKSKLKHKLYKLKCYILLMATDTITISRSEYERLKKLEKLDHDLIRQFANSLEDLKQGRFKRLA